MRWMGPLSTRTGWLITRHLTRDLKPPQCRQYTRITNVALVNYPDMLTGDSAWAFLIVAAINPGRPSWHES